MMFLKAVLKFLCFGIFFILTSLSGYTSSLTSSIIVCSPNKPFTVSLEIKLPLKSHIYYKDPGKNGYPTQIEWSLPKGVELLNERWQKPQEFKDGSIGYEDSFRIDAEIICIDTSLTTLPIKANIDYLVCNDYGCIPENSTLEALIDVGKKEVKNTDYKDVQNSVIVSTPTFDSYFFVCLLAFLGGIFLNFMPCVLPILTLKLYGLYQKTTHSNPKKAVLFYTFGVHTTFSILFILLSALKSAGHKLGWGFQLQEPLFVYGMGLIFCLMVLSLLDIITLPVVSFGPSKKNSYLDNFTFGALVVLIATPCTGPFMAPALAYGLTAHFFEGLLVFQCLALGVALPFLLAGFFSKFMKFLPKPGPWMGTFKKTSSLGMVLALVWLGWILYTQKGRDGVLYFGIMIIMVTGLGVLAARLTHYKKVFFIISLAVILGCGYKLTSYQDDLTILSSKDEFNPGQIEQALSEGKTVFVQVTASWCITCQVVDKSVIQSDAIKKAFKDKDITYIKADWSKRSASITKYLEGFKRSSVPFYMVYKPQKNPLILPELLTKEELLKAMEN